jgi:hypothetical protein
LLTLAILHKAHGGAPHGTKGKNELALATALSALPEFSACPVSVSKVQSKMKSLLLGYEATCGERANRSGLEGEMDENTKMLQIIKALETDKAEDTDKKKKKAAADQAAMENYSLSFGAGDGGMYAGGGGGGSSSSGSSTLVVDDDFADDGDDTDEAGEAAAAGGGGAPASASKNKKGKAKVVTPATKKPKHEDEDEYSAMFVKMEESAKLRSEERAAAARAAEERAAAAAHQVEVRAQARDAALNAHLSQLTGVLTALAANIPRN